MPGTLDPCRTQQTSSQDLHPSPEVSMAWAHSQGQAKGSPGSQGWSSWIRTVVSCTQALTVSIFSLPSLCPLPLSLRSPLSAQCLHLSSKEARLALFGPLSY